MYFSIRKKDILPWGNLLAKTYPKRNEVTMSPEKSILRKEKSIVLYSSAHTLRFMVRVGAKLRC